MSQRGKEINAHPGPQTEPLNPFIGAESFRTGDKIFGRDSEIDEFATRLLARRVVLLHSPSGAGKTSLVQAGIIPALNKKGVHILPKVRLNNEIPSDKLPPGAVYNRYLASVLLSLDAGEGIADDAHIDYTQIVDLSQKDGGVFEYLETHAPYARGTLPKRRLGKSQGMLRSLLFFDQFEEILTLDPTDVRKESKKDEYIDVKKDFFVRLSPLLNDYHMVAIFAMREEFVAGLEQYLIYLPERLSARFRLELLGKDAAMEAIRKPPRRVRVNFEQNGAELLVERLSQVTVREGGQEVKKPGKYVEPVQLQVVCRDLFERRLQEKRISKEDVEKQGSIENALGAYYEKKVKEIAANHLEAERNAAASKLEQAIIARQQFDGRFAKIYASDADNLRLKQRFYLERLSQRLQEEMDAGRAAVDLERVKQEQESLKDLINLFEAENLLRDPQKALDLERKLRDWIEQELIVAGRLRGQAIAGEEARFGLEPSLINKLVQAFLVREEPRRGLVWYELAHDSLVRPVVTSNQTWRELHASEFEIQAARWLKAPEDERMRLVATTPALPQLVAWGEAHGDSLSAEQRDYLIAARRKLSHVAVRQDNRAELGVNLEDTGWGVIFAASAPSELRETLKELLDHRRAQATFNRPYYYREFFGADGYRPGETAQRFLARWDAGSGPANPEKMPYYLLIVGDPETIPFDFQYGLDVQYAVGRIFFESLEEYARYARSVVQSETKHAEGSFDLPNHLVVFAPQNPDDRALAMSMKFLVQPMVDRLPETAPNWHISPVLAEKATTASLRELLAGPNTPALLFTASHGVGWPMGHPDQQLLQGALLCQDWPGPVQHRRPLVPDFFFSSQDIPSDGNFLGTVIFSFGEYVAGTPKLEDFPSTGNEEIKQLAEKAFLARLPQKLLSHPQGGALAMVAHVERAWTTSFLDPEKARSAEQAGDIGPYLKLLSRLMQGGTAGMAMEDINRRYSFFSTSLSDELVSTNFFQRPRDEIKLRQMMTQTIDARNYILIGDPAVRLPVRADQPFQPPPDDWERPLIGAVSAPVQPEAPAILEGAPSAGAEAVESSEGMPVQPAAEPQAEAQEPTVGAEAPQEAPKPGIPETQGIDLDSLAGALIKGQKLKFGDYK